MERNILILSILAIVGIIGIILYQTSILNNASIAGFGYLIGVLSIIIAIVIAMIYK